MFIIIYLISSVFSGAVNSKVRNAAILSSLLLNQNSAFPHSIISKKGSSINMHNPEQKLSMGEIIDIQEKFKIKINEYGKVLEIIPTQSTKTINTLKELADVLPPELGKILLKSETDADSYSENDKPSVNNLQDIVDASQFLPNSVLTEIDTQPKANFEDSAYFKLISDLRKLQISLKNVKFYLQSSTTNRDKLQSELKNLHQLKYVMDVPSDFQDNINSYFFDIDNAVLLYLRQDSTGFKEQIKVGVDAISSIELVIVEMLKLIE